MRIPTPPRFLRTLSAAGALAAAAWGLCGPAPASGADRSRLVIHAVILAIDPSHSLVALHHEALETLGAGDSICRLRNRRDARLLARGTVIEAIAETDHQPWVLDEIRVRARLTRFASI